jgi:hypothetical protein
MTRHIVLEHSVIQGLLANTRFVQTFPSLAALVPTFAPGPCPSCEARRRQDELLRAYQKIQTAIGNMTDSEAQKLLEILDVEEFRVSFAGSGNMRVRKTFRRQSVS